MVVDIRVDKRSLTEREFDDAKDDTKLTAVSSLLLQYGAMGNHAVMRAKEPRNTCNKVVAPLIVERSPLLDRNMLWNLIVKTKKPNIKICWNITPPV